jgi:glycosyltransferase involved in cell wall biosynthesis
MRGGEKCLEVLCDFFPDATLFTIFHHKGAMSPVIEAMEIRTSWIGRLPLADPHFRTYLPLFPAAIESFHLADYQLVISTSHCVAKGVIPAPEALHISYIHTPMRYIWEMYPHYLGSARNPVKRALAPFIASRLRRWDVASSDRVDQFIANSENVQKRIRKHYDREAVVIHPPVETDYYHSTVKAGDYYLIVTALVPYKAIHIAIEAFNKLGERLIVVGDGPEQERLARLAQRNVEFLPWQDAENLRELYSGCRALIFPGEEDFGIVPLEAQACGRPVIAYGHGGVLETVIPSGRAEKSPTGVFFSDPEPAALIDAVRTFETIEFDPDSIRANALRFSKPIYVKKMGEFINARLQEKFGYTEELIAMETRVEN